MRILRAYAGVRPLYAADLGGQAAAGRGDREISRSHVVIDHDARDGVTNFVSIVGGKLSTYRLMAEQTADVVCAKLGIDQPCSTADEVLPGQGGGRGYYWLGDRLAAHEATGGGDATLICECELVTRPMLDGFLADRRRAASTTCAAAHGWGWAPARARSARSGRPGCWLRSSLRPAAARRPPRRQRQRRSGEDPLVAFLRERYRGTRPIAWGRQLQELWLSTGIYWGVLGVDALAVDRRIPRRARGGAGSTVEASRGPR